jgi:hypothetical protein
VWFRVLGPVEIEVAGLLCDGDPPERARRIMHSHLSRIRSVLGTAGAPEHGVGRIAEAAGEPGAGLSFTTAAQAHYRELGVTDPSGAPATAGR